MNATFTRVPNVARRLYLPHRRVVDPVLHVEEDAHRVEPVVDDEVDDPRDGAHVEALGHHLHVLRAVPVQVSTLLGSRFASCAQQRALGVSSVSQCARLESVSSVCCHVERSRPSPVLPSASLAPTEGPRYCLGCEIAWKIDTRPRGASAREASRFHDGCGWHELGVGDVGGVICEGTS